VADFEETPWSKFYLRLCRLTTQEIPGLLCDPKACSSCLPASGSYLDPDESIHLLTPYLLSLILKLSSHLILDFMNGIFPSGSPIKLEVNMTKHKEVRKCTVTILARLLCHCL
jgi:hypothetical protein